MSARPFALPNLLTYARIAAVPAVVLCLHFQEVPRAGEWLRWVALAIFIAAGVTDFLDGYFARKWGEFSSFGRMLDPIADKLLVSACLLMLVSDGTIRGASLFAAVIILCREILVSGLREYLAGLNVRVEVTRLAKWKTTLQLVAAIVPVVTPIGLFLLWLSATLTLYTGWDYFRAGLRHLID
jgi:cardiolipin synthase